MSNGPAVDTIAAISTAPGPAALGVVRVSGPDAGTILGLVCPGLVGPPPPREPRLLKVHDPATGERVDHVLATFYPSPASYTGEDLVELSGHGGWIAPRLVLQACLEAGARQAEPGEFTRRAYLNGKLDLVQAEAVLDLVEGRSRALHRAALRQLDRGLSARVASLRERLVHLEALLVHHIDFPEEDDAPVPLEHIVQEARSVEGALAALLASAPEGELLREGALVVLAGRPNSGKSSLFNGLIGEERAIVTDEPGTTRDAVEATVSLGGYPFRLVDTAGLREAQEAVERLGIEVARRYLAAADVVLFCAEAGRVPSEEERNFVAGVRAPVIVVRTKADREEAPEEAAWEAFAVSGTDGGGPVRTSVLGGEGLGELRARLPSLVYGGLVSAGDESPVLTRERQSRAVARALKEVQGFIAGLESGVPAEVAATHLRPAESALEELLGVISEEEVLDHLFLEFCIGK